MSIRQLLNQNIGNSNSKDSVMEKTAEMISDSFIGDIPKVQNNKKGVFKRKKKQLTKAEKIKDWESRKICSIGHPRKLKQTKNCKRKFGIEIRFEDSKGKPHTRTVRFGKGDEYYYNGDEIKRMTKLNKLSHHTNPFDPKLWEGYLLNNQDRNLDNTFVKLRNAIYQNN